ncbi:hypothetical protein HT031_006013 [Scenedesmus sp. PABB004]|nr:hypothetical protein HT031_006013 [Scenedesmus sp. PABB004]
MSSSAGSEEGALVVVDADGRRLELVGPRAGLPEGGASSDTVAEKLAGNYSEDIVQEVRRYGKPAWEATESGLDALEDIADFYAYDFRLPPGTHDAYVDAAAAEMAALEAAKAPLPPDAAAAIAARAALVEGKTAEELAWLKHKAYYRGVAKVRAAKRALEAAAADDGGAEQQPAPAAPLPGGAGAAPAQRLGLLSEEEVLVAVSDPSEWEHGWNAPGYARHPDVLQSLRGAFAGALGLPYVSPAQQAEADAAWQQLLAQERARQRAAQELADAREALAAKHAPFQAYTPEHLERQRRQRQLDAHRRGKAQAFWLSLGVAVGSSAVRWWLRRGARAASVAARRPGSVGSSRRSTRPPTPVLLRPEMIAE